MLNPIFSPGEVLLPKTDLTRWSVVACDQFTSDPAYWQAVEETAGDSPSALRVIFPEAYLGKADFDQTIAAINAAMESYVASGLFQSYPGAMIYLERTLASGAVRRGIMGLLDLECYDFAKDSTPLVRATEGTVLDRIPPRVRIRCNAPIELPHVMVLADDPQRAIIEPLAALTAAMEKLYDFPLMLEGGWLRGWLLPPATALQVTQAVQQLADPEVFRARYGVDAPPLALAVGDGNHSLATARECYCQNPNPNNRYALVELCNLHDDSLVFEAVHRAVFDIDPHHLGRALQQYCSACQGTAAPQQLTVVTPHGDIPMTIPAPVCSLTVGSVQQFLDAYIAAHGGTVDYIHGEAEARSLVGARCVSILLPAMDKNELFPTVIKDGALPRKTFSMGEAREKRYYLECRFIR